MMEDLENVNIYYIFKYDVYRKILHSTSFILTDVKLRFDVELSAADLSTV